MTKIERFIKRKGTIWKMINVEITSENKGSNPGGRCRLPYRGATLKGYLKYCNQSSLPPDSSFTPCNQPVYESLTLRLAENLGLEVPRHFLLKNKVPHGEESEVNFTYDESAPIKKKLDDRKPLYFVSRLVDLPEEEDSEILAEKMVEEKLYRDLLIVGDVSGRKQNYCLLDDGNGPFVLYIDVGCSFIDAHMGTISQREHISHLLGRSGRGASRNLRKNVKRARDYLSKRGLLTNHSQEHRREVIGLEDFIDKIPDERLLTLPRGSEAVRNLLSEEEVEEISNLLLLNMERVVRDYNKSRTHSDILI